MGEALEKDKEALEKRREHYGREANNEDIAMSLRNIGRELMDLKKHEEAENYFLEALKMRKVVYRDCKHLDVAHTLQLLGENYHQQENFRMAKKYLEEAREAVEGCQDTLNYTQASVKKDIVELLEKV